MEKRKQTNRVVFHHSLTDTGSAETFRRYHINIKKYKDIGYHYVINTDGIIENGRRENLVGAHALGKNYDSIGICLIGNFFKYEPNISQIKTAQNLYAFLCNTYNMGLAVNFHRKEGLVNSCPGPMLNRKDFLEILYRVRHY